MKTISSKKFCKLLETHGWILERINGSHYIYIKSGSDLRISVSVHKNDDLKIGLLKNY
ncbi:type II toxin-antitoxin system HicA family toxin [uncultured Brachyspira sp.]|uniref:type II toxin-antitoxin system HicA family toxin n=1 Tax=uncultured Brachyspira sp. TaxID=221953 RepID=UPI002616A9A7|nr:type II toxin-antitoxin system HicA family toxin [uncultured Brachyspira sp.]